MAVAPARRPRLRVIPILGAVLTLPVAAGLDRIIQDAAGSLLCPSDRSVLVVRVSRDLTRDQRALGSTSARCLCAETATASACRYGRPSCRAEPVSTVLAYATMIGLSFILATAPIATYVLLRRRRDQGSGLQRP
jgi:hypothetical protein